MFKLKKLYTEPKTIDPIDFFSGLNFILGEKDDSSSKNNGVGKSLCIEFINFALLKQKAHSRVSKIPKDKFSNSTLICLDFELNNINYTIKRSLADSESPSIYIEGQKHSFSKLDDAIQFLTSKMFLKHS